MQYAASLFGEAHERQVFRLRLIMFARSAGSAGKRTLTEADAAPRICELSEYRML